MSSPHRSLNACVQLAPLLSLLGCSAHTQGRPLRTRCPICREGLLTIYQDHVCGGEWHACASCGSKGDLIALAARTWKLEVPEAIGRLVHHGFEVPVDNRSIRRYVAEHVEYGERLLDLWTQARRQLAERGGPFSRAAERLGVLSPEWRYGCENRSGQLIGCLSATQVERCFAPKVMRAAANRNENVSPSAHRVFRGEQWNDVLAIPFFDLPDRISSFLFVGRNGDPMKDFVIKRANRGAMGNQHSREPFEAGLAFHPAALEQAEHYDRTVVAIGDPLLTVRLQHRHFRQSIYPLPLVSWLDTDAFPDWQTRGRRTRTRYAWQLLGDCQVVFWLPQGFDLLTLRQAVSAGGLISIVGPREQGEQALKEYLWKTYPDDLWQHIVAHARPWPEYLTDELRGRTNPGIGQLLVNLEHEGEDVDSILRQCGGAVQVRVQELRHASQSPRTIDLDGRTIIEANGEWRVASSSGRSGLVTNAILRIDRAVVHRRTKRAYLQGRILFGGQKVRFAESMDLIDADPFAWMRDLLLREGIGVLNGDRRFSSTLIRIAETFHEYKVLNGIEIAGWDPEEQRFVLPHYAIHLGGEVKGVPDGFFAEEAPGSQLERPENVSGQQLDLPAQHEDLAPLFWATVAAVITNIVAPACHEATSGICLCGRGAAAVGQAVAGALGCLTVPVRRAVDLQRALDAEMAHSWPAYFQVGEELQRKQRRRLLADRDDDRNCIVAADWITVRALALRGGWIVITGDQRMRVPEDVLETARVLLPAYLQDLSQRAYFLVQGEPDDSPVEQVLRDLARFVEERFGNPSPVLSAADVLILDRDDSKLDVLADLLGRFITEGRLKIAAQEDGRGKPTLVEVPERGALCLSHTTIECLLRDVTVEAPDPWQLARILSMGGVLIERRREEYLLDRKWLEKRWRRQTRIEARMLKLHA